MDPSRAKTQIDPERVETMPATGRGFASTVMSDPGGAVSGGDVALAADEGFAGRYEVLSSLGEGGMGEVRLCKDTRIGREVALKVIRRGVGSRSDAHRRFVREARVQGQLEHPAIVPVHDLGRDPTGAAYFTMKRVRGKTLETIVDELRSGGDANGELSPRKLLTAFVSVCQAVHFAHTRGVLHRDLKPANVMLGDFGEVYVLDWGLARLYASADDADDADDAAAEGARARSAPVEVERAGATVEGTVMGTPGYMSPEQIRGEPSELDERTDVYALGAILFELLTLAPLHAGPTPEKMFVSALQGVDARPSARAPERDVAPELEAICVRATARERADRFESARALSDAVESYLDGDRDLARRREIAQRHADAAASAAERTLSGEEASRAAALSEAGRALALDPSNADAARAMLRLLTAPPKEMPAEARAEAGAYEQRMLQVAIRSAAIAYATCLAYLPFGLWLGIREWWLAGGTSLLWIALTAAAFVLRRSPMASTTRMYVAHVIASIAAGAISVLYGSLVLTPVVVIAGTLATVVAMNRRERRVALLVSGAAMIVPLVFELTGLTPARYAFAGNTIAILPLAVNLPRVPTLTFLAFAHVALLVTSAVFVGHFRDALYRAEERLILQSWQLRQLVPGSGHPVATTPPPVDDDPLCPVEQLRGRP